MDYERDDRRAITYSERSQVFWLAILGLTALVGFFIVGMRLSKAEMIGLTEVGDANFCLKVGDAEDVAAGHEVGKRSAGYVWQRKLDEQKCATATVPFRITSSLSDFHFPNGGEGHVIALQVFYKAWHDVYAVWDGAVGGIYMVHNPADHPQLSPWAEQQVLTPEAGQRLGCGDFDKKNRSCFCCDGSEIVKTKFRLVQGTGPYPEDAYDWLNPTTGKWDRVPDDTIHWGETTPTNEAVIFILGALSVAFFLVRLEG
jgi:hypothetical protein